MIKKLKKILEIEVDKFECMHCNTTIDNNYVFCPKCHQKTENYGKPIDYSKKLAQILIIYLFIFILGLLGYLMSKNLDIQTGTTKNIANGQKNNSEPCIGVGSELCIDKVRLNFENTNKTILGEEYLGNGQFGFTFIDGNHPGAFTAKINTDCNCAITNVQVSTVR
jgi:hypothetical protein